MLHKFVKDATKLAEEAREKAITVRTKVGVCIVTSDGKFFQGANLENSSKKVYHAEEVAIIRALMQGYRGKDFVYMVQVAFADDKIYPCCLNPCLGVLWEYTHPDFKIYVTHNGKIRYAKTLREMVSGFGGLEYIYPQETRIWKKKIDLDIEFSPVSKETITATIEKEIEGKFEE